MYASQYKAEYKNPACGKPFDEIKHFTIAQMNCFNRFSGAARFTDFDLGLVELPLHLAMELVGMWNTQAKGQIVYSVVNPL